MLVWCYLYVESAFLHKELRKLHTRAGFQLYHPVWGHMPLLSLYILHFFQMGFISLCMLPTSLTFRPVIPVGVVCHLCETPARDQLKKHFITFLSSLLEFHFFSRELHIFWVFLTHQRAVSLALDCPCLDCSIHNILHSAVSWTSLHSWVSMKEWAPFLKTQSCGNHPIRAVQFIVNPAILDWFVCVPLGII